VKKRIGANKNVFQIIIQRKLNSLATFSGWRTHEC